MTIRRNDDGFILIAVLWMLAALAALASAYAVFAVETAPSAALPEHRLQAEAALRAGVELCAYRQLAYPKAARPDGGAFSTQVGISRVDVTYRAETARVDLNSAPHDMLAGLFQQLGAGAAAGQIADRIVGWRGKLKDSERREEAAIYTKAGLSYGPVGAPFDNALEIALLPGMSPDLVARALRFVTIYGGGQDRSADCRPPCARRLAGRNFADHQQLPEGARWTAARRGSATTDGGTAHEFRLHKPQQFPPRRDRRHVKRAPGSR